MSPSKSNFYSVVQSIAAAHTEAQLRSQLMDRVGELFGAIAWGISLQNPQQQGRAIEAQGVSETFLTRYQEMERDADPVLRFVLEHHAPAHEQLILTPQAWQQSILYQHVFAPANLQHMMKGPIVGQGQVIGTIQFSRGKEMTPFTFNDLRMLSGIGAHLSAQIATLRSEQMPLDPALVRRLTQRECQIVELVAQGHSNIEIGIMLHIAPGSVKQALRRMFRKLSVSSRTQMIAVLNGNSLTSK